MTLRIDFAPPAPRQASLRLGVWSVMLAVVLGTAWMMSSETEARLPNNLASMPAEEEIRAINQAIDDLNFPWLSVLTLLESSVDDSLRITQVDAEARDARLTLQGEARDSRAVLDLPGRLRSNPLVADVRVVNQSPVAGEAGAFPIRFALEVSLSPTEGGRP